MATLKNAAQLKVNLKEPALKETKLSSATLKETTLAGTRVVEDSKSVIIEKKKIVEPVVDLINTAALKNKQLVKCSVDADVMKIEFVDDLRRWPKDDIIQWLKEMSERIRNIRVVDQLKAARAAGEFRRIVENTHYSFCGFKAEVDPAGGVTCTYGSGVREALEFGLGIKRYSYTLERKTEGTAVSVSGISKKNGLNATRVFRWITIASSDLCFGDVIVNDMSVELGKKYTYRFTMTNLSDNKTTTYEATVLYEKLKIEVVNFEAKPDSLKKKVVVTCNVKNASSINVTRKDTGKVLLSSSESRYEDTNVELNKKYEYVLKALNYWDVVEKSTSVTCSSSLLPQKVNVTYEVAPLEKKVTLKWPIVPNAQRDVIERRLENQSSFKKIYEQSTKEINSYTKNDSYVDKDTSLQQDTMYVYRVSWSNEWGVSSSEFQIRTGARPQRPRLLPSEIISTIKWLGQKNVKSYEIVRFDDSLIKNLNNVTPNKTSSIGGSSSSYNDNSIQKNVLYTYRIIAKNGWGDSDPRFYDVFDKGDSLENPYVYIGNSYKNVKQSWNQDFQGMTTDGAYWYLTNGYKYGELRKTPVDKAIGKDSVNKVRKKSGYHYGDLDYFHCRGFAKGYLFLPVYDGDAKPPEIWVIDPDTMDVDNCFRESLKKPNGDNFESIGWCAVNPCDGRLYTSESYIYSNSPTNSLYSYEIHLENLAIKGNVFQNPRSIELRDYGDKAFNGAIKEAMQGGCFDYYNNLYLNSGYHPKDTEGVHVFKLVRDESKNLKFDGSENAATSFERYRSEEFNHSFECSKAILIAKSSKSGDGFKYQFDGDGVLYYQEPQGLVYHDFKNESRVPYNRQMLNGSLHIGLLGNRGAQDDEIFIKDYEHKFRETEIKNVYYCRSNLSVKQSLDAVVGGWIVVDDNTIVKRLKNQKDANSACAILRELDNNKVYSFGWLYTSSPNHNYAFSICLSDKTLSNPDKKIINYTPSRWNNLSASDTYVSGAERYEINVNGVNYFCAHNVKDAADIIELLKNYNKICYIGVGPDSDGRIRSDYNLIWLEK